MIGVMYLGFYRFIRLQLWFVKFGFHEAFSPAGGFVTFFP